MQVFTGGARLKNLGGLKHPFVQGDLGKHLARELLEKFSNPQHNFTDLEPDDEGVLMNVPQRIPSKQSGRTRQKTQSELNCK
ncbi:hypothetical protein AVEN_93182-1 [Araneus ventricosus]|uniref:Uncharacterized protein n=1 Tax=Araneus ventricosus TaxID=182803 RepID=A0A4Y2NSM4_ARAVE|nr:hypothetical protein AVEN_93182-1 [Araneus ventricosus]